MQPADEDARGGAARVPCRGIEGVVRLAAACEECGGEVDRRTTPRSSFCSDPCRYRARERRRYEADPEAARARARAYYWANREAVLARAAAKRSAGRDFLACSECGGVLEGGRRVVCGERCRDARYRRLHPDAYEANERRKVERRRERRRELRATG